MHEPAFRLRALRRADTEPEKIRVAFWPQMPMENRVSGRPASIGNPTVVPVVRRVAISHSRTYTFIRYAGKGRGRAA